MVVRVPRVLPRAQYRHDQRSWQGGQQEMIKVCGFKPAMRQRMSAARHVVISVVSIVVTC